MIKFSRIAQSIGYLIDTMLLLIFAIYKMFRNLIYNLWKLAFSKFIGFKTVLVNEFENQIKVTDLIVAYDENRYYLKCFETTLKSQIRIGSDSSCALKEPFVSGFQFKEVGEVVKLNFQFADILAQTLAADCISQSNVLNMISNVSRKV